MTADQPERPSAEGTGKFKSCKAFKNIFFPFLVIPPSTSFYHVLHTLQAKNLKSYEIKLRDNFKYREE